MLALIPAAALIADYAESGTASSGTASSGTADSGPASSGTASMPTGTGAQRLAADQSPNNFAAAPPPLAAILAELGTPPSKLIVPDLVAVVPGGIPAGRVSAVRELPGVRALLAADGGQLSVNGHQASVLGVNPREFRSWAPPGTAADQAVWASLAAGRLVTTAEAAARLGLVSGTAYPVTGSVTVNVPFGATAQLGLPGIDMIVGTDLSAQFGLVPDVALLVDAPGANPRALGERIETILGPTTKIVMVAPATVPATALPVATRVPAGQPTNYLQLFQESAARYCPGLSWTVLAAIGQIESGDGSNDGPSSAGALGPMQFMPATWQAWGSDGFGQTGPPDVNNPLDAVPSAARLLCADGASAGSWSGLINAIYDYNHATWYVSEVLQLAAEYAHEYG
jgi:hypothetical protein